MLGLPDSIRACLFDLDGVLTRTATVHFKEPGVYPYFCERHPSMRGEIRVR